MKEFQKFYHCVILQVSHDPSLYACHFALWWAYALTCERRCGRQIKSRKLTQAKYALNFWLESLSLICRGDSGIGEAVLGWGSTATTYPRGFSFNKIL
jgi:hypothetical protein